MSQAEDLTEGACCSWCGVYFVKAHGYPVLCAACYEEQKDIGHSDNISKATEKEI